MHLIYAFQMFSVFFSLCCTLFGLMLLTLGRSMNEHCFSRFSTLFQHFSNSDLKQMLCQEKKTRNGIRNEFAFQSTQESHIDFFCVLRTAFRLISLPFAWFVFVSWDLCCNSCNISVCLISGANLFDDSTIRKISATDYVIFEFFLGTT